ncbi:hypothetical protein [Pseudomonas fluorescens]|uniref:hypothetical protein n=1 Tax=Pseudomonas fluorescens TaxID=294 RepID=UPI00058A66D7|nr:hypothetical protein [Pseudomonas fluorescens]CEL28674.1 hypothetical protein SRM1_02021 [Pseudomonas fluorescens]
MIGVPMPNPRDTIIENLNQQMDQFFGAGKTVEEIPAGVTGDPKLASTPHHDRLRTQRDKLAHKLKKLAEAGWSLNKAAESVGIGYKRARLIASENGFKFSS